MKVFASKTIYWLLLLFFNAFAAFLIVWRPEYFFIISFAALVLMVLAWKTEESLIALIFYLPFQFALNVTSSIDLASGRVLIVLIFLVWIIKALAAKKVSIPYSITTILISAFLGLAFASVVFSTSQDRSSVRFLYFLSIMPLYFVSAYYLNSARIIRKAIIAFLISATLVSLIGIAEFFAQFFLGIDPILKILSQNIAPVFYGQSFAATVLANPSWLVNIGGATVLRAISLFPDPHMFAFYLGLVIPLALSLFLFSGVLKVSDKSKAAILLVNIILFSALLFTFSRAGYVGAAFGVAAIVIAGWKFFSNRVKFTIGTIVIIGGILLFNSSNLVIARFFSSFNPSEGSNSERLLNWNRALKTISDYPLTGVGIGAYSLAIDPRSGSRSAITAHNTYLDIAAEMGIFALLVWVALLAATIKKLTAFLSAGGRDLDEQKVFALGLLGSFVWFSAQSIFDTAIYSPTLFAILMVYWAIVANLDKRKVLSE